MDEYLCLTVRSEPGESEQDFGKRLSLLWSRMLRERKDDFEKVYAETVKFSREGDELTRDYLVEAGAVDAVTAELRAAGIRSDGASPAPSTKRRTSACCRSSR